MLDWREQWQSMHRNGEIKFMPTNKTDPKPRLDQPKPSEQHEGLPGLFDPTALPEPTPAADAHEHKEQSEEKPKKKPPAAQTAGGL